MPKQMPTYYELAKRDFKTTAEQRAYLAGVGRGLADAKRILEHKPVNR